MSEFEDMDIVIAVFNNESAAVGALAGMEHWADSRKEIKLGSVGALSIEDGEIVSEIVRKAEKGPLVSGAMGLAKSFLGPLTLVGNVIGGVAGAFSNDEEQETPEAFKKLAQQMEAGRVSLVMVSTANEAEAYRAQLEAMCGQVTLYLVPQEKLEEAAAALEAAEAQAEAQEKAQKEAEKQKKKEEKEQKKEEKRAKEDE